MCAQLALVPAPEQEKEIREPTVLEQDQKIPADMENERMSLLSVSSYVDFGDGRGMWIGPSTD